MGAILTSPDCTVIQKELNHDFYPDFCNIKKRKNLVNAKEPICFSIDCIFNRLIPFCSAMEKVTLKSYWVYMLGGLTQGSLVITDGQYQKRDKGGL